MNAPHPAYRIEGPALISFSGGRTSAYMLHEILRAHDGKLPDDVHVCFANTGKEREETLRFVHECGSRWGARVRWLEFVTDLRSVGAAGRFEEVGYNSANRNGEPLRRLIARKKALFSTQSGRWCTEFAKVRAMSDFMETQGFMSGDHLEVIGFRADEYDRVVETPLTPRNVDRRFAFPLARAGVRKPGVLAFWDQQPFDLMLPKGTGNCDHCPFLSKKARVARARINPEGLPWWGNLEVEYNFAFGRISVADIQREIVSSPLLPMDDVEADAADTECGAWCAAA